MADVDVDCKRARRYFVPLLIACFAAAQAGCGDGPAPAPPASPPAPVQQVSGQYPAQLASDRYVGRAACAQCHQKEHDLWLGSDHDLAMDHATDKTVLGDFNNTTFTHFGTTSRFFKKDGRYFVNTDGPDGKHADFEVLYVFGVRPLQQYLIELPNNRLQSLSIAWDVQAKKWFHLYPNEAIPHSDVLHWTKPLQNWNYMCASCHSTDLQKKFDARDNAYRTTFFEMDVSCEACHGPGRDHVDWAKATPFPRKRAETWPDDWDPKLANPMKDRDAWTQVQTCAPCHARRSVVYPGHEPGKKFFDHFTLATLDEGLYHADGQILDEVYEAGSFLQSKMFHKGVRCSNCHEPHSLKLVATGNNLCNRCHGAEKYDTPAHHHHPAESKGALCVECHMPTKTYMGVDVRRDHSFRVPRPDLSVALGTPNACTQCHADMSDELAAQTVVQLWGAVRKDDPHFAHAFAAARKGDPKAIPALVALVRNKDRPGIVRATALNHLGQMPTLESMKAIIAALRDEDVQVRIAAARAADRFDVAATQSSLRPLLKDEVRAVRIEAMSVLSRLGAGAFGEDQPAFSAAWNEFVTGQFELADQPGAWLNMAVLHENLGEIKEAEEAYLKAIQLDPAFVPARMNLAVLLAGQNRQREAETQLREAVRLWPDSAQAHYSLGLLLGEDPAKLAEAAQHLGKAATLAKTDARMFYNYGLVLQHLKKPAEAEAALKKANELRPDDADLIQAMVAFYVQAGRWREARPYARRVAELFPQDERAQEQYRFIKEKAERE